MQGRLKNDTTRDQALTITGVVKFCMNPRKSSFEILYKTTSFLQSSFFEYKLSMQVKIIGSSFDTQSLEVDMKQRFTYRRHFY